MKIYWYPCYKIPGPGIDKAKEFFEAKEQFFFIVPRVLAKKKIETVFANYNYLGDRIGTFGSFSRKLLDECFENKRLLSNISQQFVVENALNIAKEQGLKYFNTDLKGFVMAFIRLFNEFGQARVTLELIDEWIKKADDIFFIRKLKDIKKIYSCYIESLQQLSLLDNVQRLKVTEALITKGNADNLLHSLGPFIIDGFHDFTSMQISIINAINKRGAPIYLFMPDFGKFNTLKDSLLDKLKFFIPNIQEEYNENVQHHEHHGSTTLTNHGIIQKIVAGSIYSLPSFSKGGLGGFLEENKFTEEEIAKIFHIIEAPSEELEIETIAKEIKHLILSQNYSPSDIAVIFRNKENGSIISEIFDKYGIPFSSSFTAHLKTNTLIQFIFSLFDIYINNFERKKTLWVLNNGYLHPFWENINTDFEKLDLISRNLRVLYSRDSWDGVMAELLNYEANKEFANKLKEFFTLYDLLPELNEQKKSLKEHIEALYLFLTKLLMFKDHLNTAKSKDLLAWNKFIQIIKNLIEIAGISNKFNMKFEDFIQILKDVVFDSSFFSIRNQAGGVTITDVTEAMGTWYKVIFLARLSEKKFPQSFTFDPIFKIEERKSINEISKEDKINMPEILLIPINHYNKEEFLFYSTISRATEQIFLSYPYIEKDKETLGSYFLNELNAKLCEFVNEKTEVETVLNPVSTKKIDSRFHGNDNKNETNVKFLWQRRILLDSIIPLKNKIYTIEELALWTFYNIGIGRKNSDVIEYLKQKWTPLFNFAFEGAKAEQIRLLSNSTLTKYEGKICNLDLLQNLKLIGTSQKPISPTSLEKFGKCPFQYFISKLCNLNELSEIEEQISALDEGTICHEILEETFKDFFVENENTNHPNPPLLNEGFSGEKLFASLNTAINNVMNKKEKQFFKNKPPYYWILLRKRLAEIILPTFLEIEIERINSKGFWPSHFEYFFSTNLEINEKTIYLNGKIDRVDVSGNNVLIIDYKLNSLNGKKFCDFANLELPLYLIAIQNKLNLEPYGGFYRSIKRQDEKGKDKTSKSREKNKKDWTFENYIDLGKKIVYKYVDMIHKGFFPPYCEDKEELNINSSCEFVLKTAYGCSYCSFKDLCRVKENKLIRRV